MHVRRTMNRHASLGEGDSWPGGGAPPLGRLRLTQHVVRAATHMVMSGEEISADEAAVIKLEANASLEAGSGVAVAVLSPSSSALVHAAAGRIFLGRRAWVLLEPGASTLVQSTNAGAIWVVAMSASVINRHAYLISAWPDVGRLGRGVIPLLKAYLRNEASHCALAHLLSRLTEAPSAGVPPVFMLENNPRRVLVHRRVRSARLHLHGQLHEGANVNSAARVALLSKWHFAKTFQRMYGISPQAYLTELRVSRARALVIDSRLSISEISALCGFENPASMSRAFKLRFGVSARDVRAQQAARASREQQQPR